MPRHFTQLWHHTTADWHLSRRWILGHTASKQKRLGNAKPDDTVWVVTVYPEGELVLLGRVRVGRCTDREEAQRGFDYEVWPADYHAIALPGTEEPMREVDLMGVAGDLRFVSKVNDRLALVEGQRPAATEHARVDPGIGQDARKEVVRRSAHRIRARVRYKERQRRAQPRFGRVG